MKTFLLIAVFALVSNPCCSRAVNEESVVSVYTTPTNAGAGQLDVYGQIASNIAEKITSPIYRFFGVNSSEHQTTKRPFEHIELQDDPNNTNEIPARDVEELSAKALKKTDKKPEKVTLFSSYLPASPIKLINEKVFGKIEMVNETKNEIDDDFDDDFDLDDVEEVESPRGPFVYLLELIGSIIQLLWGGFLAIFKPANNERTI